jgi:hypothetical protein
VGVVNGGAAGPAYDQGTRLASEAEVHPLRSSPPGRMLEQFWHIVDEEKPEACPGIFPYEFNNQNNDHADGCTPRTDSV